MAKLRVLVPEATINYVKNPSFRFDISGWSGKDEKKYVLLDRFTTSQAAPLTSPRTCEPGPGTLTIVDTGNKLSISGGKIANSSNTVQGDPIASSLITRRIGRSFYYKFSINSGTGQVFWIGARSIAVTPNTYAFTLPLFSIWDNGISVNPESALSSGVIYEAIFVLQNPGALYFVRGGAYSQWTLVWVSNQVTSNMYILFAGGSAAGTWEVDVEAVFDLISVFSENYRYAETYLQSPSPGYTGTMTADGFVDFTWTPSAAEILEIDIRRIDNDNRWIVRCDQAGSTIKLIERNAGVETERASAAQTWTPGTAYTVKVRAVGNDIRTFVDSVTKNTYTSASFNNTATGIKVSGFATGANLASFPRIPGATIQAEINEHLP